MNNRNLQTLAPILFNVEKKRMAEVLKGYKTNSKDEFAIIGYPEDGKMLLNTCSKQYKIIRNEDVLLPLVDLTENLFGDISLRVIAEENCRFDVNIIPVKGTPIVGELLPRFNFSNTYDSTGLATLEGGIYRTTCSNGAAVPVKGKSIKYTFKHNDREILNPGTWEEVTLVMQTFIDEFPKIEANVMKMKKKIITSNLNEFLEDFTEGTLFPKKAINTAASRALMESTELGEKVNLWLAYNGLNYVLNHDREYKIVQHVRNTLDSKLLDKAMSMV